MSVENVALVTDPCALPFLLELRNHQSRRWHLPVWPRHERLSHPMTRAPRRQPYFYMLLLAAIALYIGAGVAYGATNCNQMTVEEAAAAAGSDTVYQYEGQARAACNTVGKVTGASNFPAPTLEDRLLFKECAAVGPGKFDAIWIDKLASGDLVTRNYYRTTDLACGTWTTVNSDSEYTLSKLGWQWTVAGCPPGTFWDTSGKACLPVLLDKSLGPQCQALAAGSSKSKLMCGNPINVAIGNKFQAESDFSLAPLLAFTRYYNSISIGRSDSLGPQWSHTYARNVAYTGAGTATPVAIISRPEGNRVVFTLTASVWTADADVIATLSRRDNAQSQLLGWTYTPQDSREVEQYDALGRLLQITKSDGSAINLTYNNGVIENNANDLRLTQVQAQDGRSLVLAYDANNRIHQITDPSGGVYLYDFDTSGRLSTVTYPGGAQHTYLYNEPAFTAGASLPNALTGIVHEDGQRFATFNYQADGRAISTEHAGAVDKFAVQYNADGTSTVTTPLGTTQQRTFNTVLGVKEATSTVETCPDCSP